MASLLLLLCLVSAVAAVPVKDSRQQSMMEHFGPPPDSHVTQIESNDIEQQKQQQEEQDQDQDQEPSGPVCPPASLCVPAALCSSADAITYEQSNDIYHPSSQYDQQTATQRFTCGRSGSGHVCCPADSVQPPSSSGEPHRRIQNPFGFPDALGTDAFQTRPDGYQDTGSGSGSGTGSSHGPSFPGAGGSEGFSPGSPQSGQAGHSGQPGPGPGGLPQGGPPPPGMFHPGQPGASPAPHNPFMQAFPPPPSVLPSSSGGSVRFPGGSGGPGGSGFPPQPQGQEQRREKSRIQRLVQQVMIRGQLHTLPEFSSNFVLPDGSEGFSTHETNLVSLETRPAPGFAPTGRTQTVMLRGRQHVTGEFVYVSDPNSIPIIVTTAGVPQQFSLTGGEFADIDPFVPQPELVMLAAEILRSSTSSGVSSADGSGGSERFGGSGGSDGGSPPPGQSPPPPPPPRPASSLQPPRPPSGQHHHSPPPQGGSSHFGGFSDSSGSGGGGGGAFFEAGGGGGFDGGQNFGGQAGGSQSFGGQGFDQQTSLPPDPTSHDPHLPGTPHGAPHGAPHGHHQGPHHGPPHHGSHHHSHHGPHHGPPHFPHHPPPLHLPPPPLYSLGHHLPPLHHGLTSPLLSPVFPGSASPTCGLRGQLSAVYASIFGRFSGRISSGFGLEPGVADYAAFPWHAAVLRRTSPGDRRGLRLGGLEYVCGATLVSADAVITAAHCVQGDRESDLVIRLGDYNLYSVQEELFPPYDASVRSIHIHPDYLSSVYRSDIAVLLLAGPVPLHSLPHVTPACLPGPDLTDESTVCEVPGWGYDAYKTQVPEDPHALKAVTVRPVSPEVCEASLSATLLGNAFRLQEGSFCAAGSHGQDTCLGDGGGGLVCPEPAADRETSPGRYLLVGVTSWGVRCGDGTPGVYTNVRFHREWIDSVIQGAALRPPIVIF